MIIYTVKAGDTLQSISEEYGINVSQISADNQLGNAPLVTGQALVLRYPTQIYTVREGDTLSQIAENFGTTVISLWQNNPGLAGGGEIFPGQTLVISYEAPTLGEISTNGYAYTYISDGVLRQTLPYLTYLSVFSYGLNPDGSLVPTRQDDTRLIAAAKENGTVPIMMLSSLTAEGNFSNELVNSILQNEELTTRVIENTAEIVRSKGYGGVETDFEYISSEYADEYAEFVERLKSELGTGYTVFTDLAPKTYANMPGLLYESHNYDTLGEAADKAFLMTYEWGYQYGPPLAVSPINNVSEVLEYAIQEISPQKLFLGLPSYGYDWSLPYIRGTAATPLSNVEAIDLARTQGVPIQFDTEAQAPFFTYNESGVDHIVWFQDARSVEALGGLASVYSLDGIGVWNIMRYFPALWQTLSGLYDIRKF